MLDICTFAPWDMSASHEDNSWRDIFVFITGTVASL